MRPVRLEVEPIINEVNDHGDSGPVGRRRESGMTQWDPFRSSRRYTWEIRSNPDTEGRVALRRKRYLRTTGRANTAGEGLQSLNHIDAETKLSRVDAVGRGGWRHLGANGGRLSLEKADCTDRRAGVRDSPGYPRLGSYQ